MVDSQGGIEEEGGKPDKLPANTLSNVYGDIWSSFISSPLISPSPSLSKRQISIGLSPALRGSSRVKW